MLGNTKLEAIGVARRDQNVPAVGNPRRPLDLEAGNTQGAFMGQTWHPGNRQEPTGALVCRAGTQRVRGELPPSLLRAEARNNPQRAASYT